MDCILLCDALVLIRGAIKAHQIVAQLRHEAHRHHITCSRDQLLRHSDRYHLPRPLFVDETHNVHRASVERVVHLHYSFL